MLQGTCTADANSERFYFNSFTQECRPFNYTGCGGNENNFLSKDECLNRCLRKCHGPEIEISSFNVRSLTHCLYTIAKDICMQEISTGPCRALIERWAYNRKTHQCEEFDYGGCQGNGNNFETKSACDSRCPGTKDLRVCCSSSKLIS